MTIYYGKTSYTWRYVNNNNKLWLGDILLIAISRSEWHIPGTEW